MSEFGSFLFNSGVNLIACIAIAKFFVLCFLYLANSFLCSSFNFASFKRDGFAEWFECRLEERRLIGLYASANESLLFLFFLFDLPFKRRLLLFLVDWISTDWASGCATSLLLALFALFAELNRWFFFYFLFDLERRI